MLRPVWWLSIVYLVIVLYLMCIFQIYADTRQKMRTDGKQYKSTTVIADVVHDNFDYEHSTWICDALIYPCLFLTIVRLLLTRCGKERRKRISKFISVLATLYLIRCFTIIATVMPNPDKNCVMDERLFPNWFYGAFLIVTGQSKTCSDEIFSGHTVNLLTCVGVWIIYHRSALVYIVASIYTTLTLWMIAATRYHYTIDVVVGFIVAVLLHLICYRREIHAKFHPEQDIRSSSYLPQPSCVQERPSATRSYSPPQSPYQSVAAVMPYEQATTQWNLYK